MNGERVIFVYAGWCEPAAFIGRLFVSQVRARESVAFEYDRSWSSDVMLDPELPLVAGRQFPYRGKNIWGMFADSCPDRWGRSLIRRREMLDAAREGRRARALTETDYLTRVLDEARSGGLRFALEESGEFVSVDSSVPPFASLRELEDAASNYEEMGDDEAKLRILLAPGSSLGGARPKASIRNVDGSLWIAKFPSRDDENDTGAWEMTARDLASLCGLDVPEARLVSFSRRGSTYMAKRFDRVGEKRIHFASAMTMLGRIDGEEASYLDIASFIRSHGAEPARDLAELWRRVVFSMAISNTDDHLRNHGFLLTPNGWRLSPMYDVNPVSYGSDLSTCVDENDTAIDVELAVSTAEYYGIKITDARRMASEILEIVGKNWENVAARNGLNRKKIERMRGAFAACTMRK